MRYYSDTIKQRVKARPKSLGATLLRLAIAKEVSILDLTKSLGTSRQTLYNWSSGHEVSNAYQHRVRELIQKLKNARSAT
jgi:hypothetical protein